MLYEQWSTTTAGESLDIVYIPWSDDTYLKDGIYVSFGNFLFDFVFLTLELLGLYFAFRVAKQKILNWKTNA